MKALLKLLLVSIFFIHSQHGIAQNMLYGNIFNQDGEILIGATVQWDGTTIGTSTNVDGDFWLPKMDTTAYLLITYVGYDPVYIEMFPHEDTAYIKIEGITELVEVEVSGQSTDNFTSTLDPINLENIGHGELQKAACCSLAESFETNGAVDVMAPDAVTSAKEIQMLGLRGIYSQLLMEKRPVYTGLAMPLALDYIPGTWVSGIQISKGASTVQNGPQAITGQINTELMKPFQDKPFFLNLFGSTVERGEANLHLNKQWNEEWSSGALLHGSTTQGVFDENKDGFQDQATKETLNGLFRTFYRGEKIRSQLNVQVISDKRESGQVLPDGDFDPTEYYRIVQDNQRVDMFGKIGFIGFEKPGTSVGFIYNALWHEAKNVFGNRVHNGTQKRLYGHLMYATILGTSDHKLNIGANFQMDDFDEQLDDVDLSRRETMPGAYAEYSYSTPQGFGLIAGIRGDYHNQFGFFATPRVNLKYNFSENSIVRLSAGRGVRSAQVVAENLSMLATNAPLVFLEELDKEDAWNMGLNFTQNFQLLGRNASIIADLYRTDFRNQIVVDRESKHGEILVYNLQGKSYSNSFLSMFSWEAFKGFDIKMAYKLNDVNITFFPPTFFAGSNTQERPLTVRHRGLIALTYRTPDEKWMFNSNIQVVGGMLFAHQGHLSPDVANAERFQGTSPTYALVNAQVTRKFKNFELYLGGENLTNYTQEYAIVEPDNPFGEYFDAMQVYAPLVGARGYIGLRFWLE